MTQTADDHALDRIAERTLLETVFAMQLDALERSGMDAETYILVRLAALVAMDAPPVSYAFTIGAAAEAGVTLAQARRSWSPSPRSSERPGSPRPPATSSARWPASPHSATPPSPNSGLVTG